MTNKSIRTLSLLLLTTLPATVSSLGWQLDSQTCDGAPFDSPTISVTCDGTTDCQLGNTATISGSVTATTAFADADVTLQPCIATYCPEKYAIQAGKACDWLEPTDGQECGEAGGYAVNYEAEIPGEDSVPSGWGWLISVVTVRIMVGGEEECLGETAEGYQMSYSMAGLGGLAIGAAMLFERRRRRIRGSKEGVLNEDVVEEDYVEMGKMPVL